MRKLVHPRFVRTMVLALATSCLLAVIAQGQENEETREVRRRLKVMRAAVEAFVEADQHDRAALVEQAMHARELSLEGRLDAEANQIRDKAPNRGALAELLAAAAELVADRGEAKQAQALAELSRTYANQHLRRQRSVPADLEEAEARDLNSLEQRVRILDWARGAHAEAGREDGAELLQNAVHYGKQLLQGADVPAAAAAGVPSLGNLSELLQVAAQLYAEWGQGDRQHACLSLAGYYRRLLGEEGETDAREERHAADRAGDISDLAHRLEVIRHAQAAHEEAGHGESAAGLGQYLHMSEVLKSSPRGNAGGDDFSGMNRGPLIELLRGAHDLCAKWGHEQRAMSFQRLAEFYAQRELGRRTAGDRPPVRRERRDFDTSDHAQRMEILRMVRAAHAEAGNHEAAETMERILLLAELQLEQASDEKIAEAAQGLTQNTIVDLSTAAGRQYREWGNAQRAELCEQLVNYYRHRAEDRETGARQGSIEEIIERIERMQEELQELKAALRQIRDR